MQSEVTIVSILRMLEWNAYVSLNVKLLFNVKYVLLFLVFTELTSPSQFSVRLIGGATEYEGRVEFYYNGQWGTVCDDSWDINDATVVCRQLHFTGASEALRLAPFGAGTGPIWLDNVLCTGSEQGLNECPHNGFGSHDCSHNEDAGVRCRGNYTQYLLFLYLLFYCKIHKYVIYILL